MKQTRLMKMLFVPAALSLFAACSSDNDIAGDKNPTEDKGVTLTINATAGGEAVKHQMSRVQYNKDYTVAWTSDDKVYAFAGSTTNAGLCTITPNPKDNHNATLKVILKSTPKAGDQITAYVANTGITAGENGLGDQVEVDYSNQDGTYADATSRCVLFGKTTYDPAKSDELSMNFEYQTTFFKLSLDFQDATVAGNAKLYLTGDNVYSISRMNTTGANAGELGTKNGFTITVPEVTVTGGKANGIYLAMYPGQVQNVKLQAVMTDGKTYEFTLGNATLVGGKVYNIAKKGAVVKTEAAAYAGGTGKATDPWQISNLAQLNYLREQSKADNKNTSGKYFVLTNDIVINGSWTPIDNFHGILDAQGYAILGNIEVSTTANNTGIGLFGNIGYNAVVKNLTNKANIIATATQSNVSVGGIVGRINTDNVQILNCVNRGMINSKTQNAGGIVGEIVSLIKETSKEVLIEACRNEGDIKTSGQRIGGVVANIYGNDKGVQTINIKGCLSRNVSFATSNTTCYTGGILGNLQKVANANIINITACWTSDLSFPKVGNKCGIVGASKSDKVLFTLNNCWTNASTLVVKDSPATMNECYLSKDKTFSDWVTEANTAWNSSEYEFNADGTINVKK